MGAIKGLKKQYSECEWIVVFLYPDGERSKGAGIYAGRGEYTKDQVDISHWIPSQKQLGSFFKHKRIEF